MNGADYISKMRKAVLSANNLCRFSEKEFRVLTGDLAHNPQLSAVFVFCKPAECTKWRSQLTDLVKDTHLSLQVVPYATDPHFIIRGTMGADWVFVNLWDKPDPPLNVIALDLEPLRMRWFDVEKHGSGPVVVHREVSQDGALQHLKRATAKRKGDGRLVFEPTGTMFYLLFQSAETARELAEKIRADVGLPLRDLFLIPDQSRHRLDSGVKTKIFSEGSSLQREHLLQRTEVIALVEMGTGVVCVPDSQEHRPYQQLIEWGRQFETKSGSGVHDVRVEVLPCEPAREAEEFGDPYKTWIEYLESQPTPIKKRDRVPVGWLQGAGSFPTTAKDDPAFEIPQRPTAILGVKGTGKSVIAYHLLAQYVKRQFTVIFINYKNASMRSGLQRDTGPREHSELLDFAGVIRQATATDVIARPWPQIAQDTESPARRGCAYYMELWPGPAGVPSRQVCEEVIGALGEDVVFCFDEVVNETKNKIDLDPGVRDTMEYLLNVGRTSHVLTMIIHQSLSQLSEGGWPGFKDQCCFLMAGLDATKDKNAYMSFSSGKPSFLEYDVPFERLERFQGGKFALVPPVNLRDHAPIPLEIPEYHLLEDDKAALKGRLPWDTIDYPSWENEARKGAPKTRAATPHPAQLEPRKDN